MALALAAALLPLAAHAAPAEDWFRAYQYAARPQTLRGCSDCAGEHDDVCEVPAGVLAQPIGEYAWARWPAPGRLKLLRSKADPDCAVPAFGPKGTGPMGWTLDDRRSDVVSLRAPRAS